MDISSTKKKRGRPSKGLSDYIKVSARLTEEQYDVLVDYGFKHNIVDKKGRVNPSEVVRVAIDSLADVSTIKYNPPQKSDIKWMLDRLGSNILFLRGLVEDLTELEDREWLSSLADDTYRVYSFLSTLLP